MNILENKFRPKNNIQCVICKKSFRPTSPRNKLCSDECRDAYYKNKGLNKRYRNGVYIPSGYNQKGENNNNWKYGCQYRGLLEVKECDYCKSAKNLLIHHKDENRKNNNVSNLIVLCKKCHQNLHCIRDEKGRFISRKV